MPVITATAGSVTYVGPYQSVIYVEYYDSAIFSQGGNLVAIEGSVVGGYYALSSNGYHASYGNSTISIGLTGNLYADIYGIGLRNGGDTILNQGTVYGNSVGIGTIYLSNGVFRTLDNTGTIAAGGEVSSGINAAIYTNSAGQDTLIRNSGIILTGLANSFAIQHAGISNDRITNMGTILGKVSLGLGDDTLDTRLGYLEGEVSGGEGSDRLLGSKQDDIFFGDGGADILSGFDGDDDLRGGIGNDILRGGNGNDILNGGSGKDTVNGGAGDDILTGGASADIFVFARSHGTAVITDFQDGTDKIDLAAYGFASATDARAFAADAGGNVVFTFSVDNVLTVENLTKAQLAGVDFIL